MKKYYSFRIISKFSHKFYALNSIINTLKTGNITLLKRKQDILNKKQDAHTKIPKIIVSQIKFLDYFFLMSLSLNQTKLFYSVK